MLPTISVILPVYNQQGYLAQAIESVLAQSYADFELLVHDDGSTDASAQLIRHYAALDTRIRPSFAPNAGRSVATNALVAQARGQWCAFLDADDVMLPQRLARQLAFHQAHAEVDASSCHCHYINEAGQHLGTQRYPGLRTVEEGRQALANNNFVLCAITGLMISRQAFMQSGGLRATCWPCDDHDLFNRLLEQGYGLVIMQEVLMHYRIHTSAITMRQPLHTFDVLDYSTHCTQLRRAGQPEPTLTQFMAAQQQSSWWAKANRRRFQYSILFHREAGFCLNTKKYFHFGWHLTKALVLSPGWVFTAVRKKLTQGSALAFSAA